MSRKDDRVITTWHQWSRYAADYTRLGEEDGLCFTLLLPQDDRDSVYVLLRRVFGLFATAVISNHGERITVTLLKHAIPDSTGCCETGVLRLNASYAVPLRGKKDIILLCGPRPSFILVKEEDDDDDQQRRFGWKWCWGTIACMSILFIALVVYCYVDTKREDRWEKEEDLYE